MRKKLIALLFVLILVLAACGGGGDKDESGKKEKITFGATPGPYSDMVNEALKPLLEEKGYDIENIEFSDYIQPNNALDNGDIDVNLFQHTIYYEAFAEENKMDLSGLIIVPTAPMGLYSNTFESMEDIADGSTMTVPNDPTNLSRTIMMLEAEGLVTIKDNMDPLTASLKDIDENPKNLKFHEVEAGQLPRTVDSEDIASVPGNFALAADFDLLDAIALEDMPDDYRNIIVVNTDDMKAEWVQDIKEVVESEAFEKIIDEEFEGFGKPTWMEER